MEVSKVWSPNHINSFASNHLRTFIRFFTDILLKVRSSTRSNQVPWLKTEKVLKAIQEADLAEALADLDTSELLTLHAGGYRTASKIKAAQREGLQKCDLVPASVSLRSAWVSWKILYSARCHRRH